MKWKYKDLPPDNFFTEHADMDHLLLTLLYNRGITTDDAIREFLSGDSYADPFLFPDMSKFVERIKVAVEKQEHIVIHGDYDVDGVSATSILYLYLTDVLGIEHVDIYIPNRFNEGYGITKHTIDTFLSDKINLLISVDCGIKDIIPLEYAMEQGIDVIISDHHTLGEQLPKVSAIIHPKDYPYHTLSGSAVAFKMTQAMDQAFGKSVSEEFVDLAGLGVVCDVMELTGENRVIVKHALRVLHENKRLGLEELFLLAGVDKRLIDMYHIGFVIGPRLNASGRMDSADESFHLLTSKTSEKAKEHAAKLHQLNAKRQDEMKEAIAASQQYLSGDAYINVLYIPHISVGVIGLVAGKITEMTHKPTIVLTDDSKEGLLSGSARSIDEFHMVHALDDHKQLFFSYGGHAKAAGLKVQREKLANFTAQIGAYAKNLLEGKDLSKTLPVDMAFELAGCDLAHVFSILTLLEPFGEANPRPIFESRARVANVVYMGENGKHLKLQLYDPQKSNGFKIEAVGFGMGERKVRTDDTIDMVYNIERNVWNGTVRYQLHLIDFILA
jgi:single-stranded-DNA-specific exonuclease